MAMNQKPTVEYTIKYINHYYISYAFSNQNHPNI